MQAPALVAHADWSTTPKKRAWAVAERVTTGRYRVTMPPVPKGTRVVAAASELAGGGPALLGFDFPIGLPAAFARRAEIEAFKPWLAALPDEVWVRFCVPALRREDIGLGRPFYPYGSKGATQGHLVQAIGVPQLTALLRRCEWATMHRSAASCLFWTLGAKQCGRAALAGWHEVIRPAVRSRDENITLWPFDGDLEMLLDRSRVVVAETYPADACHQLGLSPPIVKSRQEGRQRHATAILGIAESSDLDLEPALEEAVRAGFGAEPTAQDRFDAMVGLLAMLQVVRGGRAAGAPADPTIRCLEGWIMGLDAASLRSPRLA